MRREERQRGGAVEKPDRPISLPSRFKTSIEGSPKKRSQVRYWVLEPHET